MIARRAFLILAIAAIASCGGTVMCWEREPRRAADHGERPNWPRLDALPDVTAPALAGSWPDPSPRWRVEGRVESFQCSDYGLTMQVRSASATETLKLSPARTRFPIAIDDRVIADHVCTATGCKTVFYVNGMLVMARVGSSRIGAFTAADFADVEGWTVLPDHPPPWSDTATRVDLVVTHGQNRYALPSTRSDWTKVEEGSKSFWIAGIATTGGACSEGCNASLQLVVMPVR